MLKIIFLAIVTINVQADDAEDLFQVVDSIISPLVPIGDPETPVVEDGEKMKKICGLVNKDFISKQSSRVGSLLKGLMAKMVQSVLDNYSPDNYLVCQLIKEGNVEKAVLMIKEYNRHAVEANKVRLSFLTAIHELKQKGTKASLPTLTCYLKQFADKFIAVYPEKDGARESAKTGMGHIFKHIFATTLEKETGKGTDSCPIPESSSNPSKFNSPLVATFVTVQALQDK